MPILEKFSNSDHQEARRAELASRCSLRCSSFPHWTRGSSSSSLKASSKLSFLSRSPCPSFPSSSLKIIEGVLITVASHKVRIDNNFDLTQEKHSYCFISSGLHISLPKVAFKIFENPKRPQKLASNLGRLAKTLRGYLGQKRIQGLAATSAANLHNPKMAFITTKRWKYVMKVQNLLLFATLQSKSLAYIYKSQCSNRRSVVLFVTQLSMYLFSKLWYQGCPKIRSDLLNWDV